MTQIDFYIEPANPLQYAARLARKAYGLERKIIIVVANQTQAIALDEYLWQIAETDFIPHVNIDDTLATQTPVVLMHWDNNATGDDIKLPHYDIMVNLTAHIPPQFSAFNRLCEVVESAAVELARERYRAYQKRGYLLTSNKVQ